MMKHIRPRKKIFRFPIKKNIARLLRDKTFYTADVCGVKKKERKKGNLFGARLAVLLLHKIDRKTSGKKNRRTLSRRCCSCPILFYHFFFLRLKCESFFKLNFCPQTLFYACILLETEHAD